MKEFSGNPEWQNIFQNEIQTSRLEGRPLLDAGEAFAEVLSIMLLSGEFAIDVESLGIRHAISFISERGLNYEA